MLARDGFHVLGYCRGVDHDLLVVLLASDSGIIIAVSAMAQGAFSFLEKPSDLKDLIRVLERALRSRATVIEVCRLKVLSEVDDLVGRLFFGRSKLAEALPDEVLAAARLDTDVIVKGASSNVIAKIVQLVHFLPL